MNEEKDLEIVGQDFVKKAINLDKLMSYQETFFDNFLKIKLAFLTFNGIIISIVFANKNDFSQSFLFLLVLVFVFLFMLLVIDLYLTFKDITHAIKNQYKITLLAKIRHIAKLRGNVLEKYGERAEELLIQENKVEQKMLNNESISEIIRYPRNFFSNFIFIVWLIILAGTPILFLFEVLDKFR